MKSFWSAAVVVGLACGATGDARGQALGINGRRQVVGFSRGAGFRGVIWENDAVTDLNTLIVAGSRDVITVAGDINDFGMITGTSVDAAGVSSTFLAIPTRSNDD